MAKNNGSSTYENAIPKAPISSNYPGAYNFYCVKSIEELTNIITSYKNTPVVAFDTETTGLNMDECQLVGYSFCCNGVDAYYVPVNHAPYKIEETGEERDDSLGEKAVDIFYSFLRTRQLVLLFNARFDMRVFEKYGFIEHDIPYSERDEKLYYKYDMSQVPFFDVQALIYLTDTNIAYPSLKKSEEWFLGWRGASFEETLGNVDNFYYLRPDECYTYAATDALGTFLLYYCKPAQNVIAEVQSCTRYPKQWFPGMLNSLELDNNFLYPLMMMEEEKTFVDTDKLRSYSEYYTKEIERVENEIYGIAGQTFNIASPVQKSQMLKKLNIQTVEYDGTPAISKTGNMCADKEHIGITIDKLKLTKDDPKRIFMEDLLYYATLTKQRGTYTDNFIEMANASHYDHRLRFGYKTITVPSGRLAAGGDKKNSYSANCNIQNLPKPHMGNVYYVRYDEACKLIPELFGAYDNDYMEYNYNGEHTYKILDWIFKETVWNLGIPEKKVEGFFQDLNVRSAMCADKDKAWVSCDYSAQELRACALISKDPMWTEAFYHDEDLHKKVAKLVWGPENYTKTKRKHAKAINFGIIYGKTAHNFSKDLDISIEEAEKLVSDYKATAPTLFKWIGENEKVAQETGSVHTLWGRPRRLGWYFNSDQPRSMKQFGLRSATNTVVQGSGADILKIAFLNLYNTFYANPAKRNQNRKLVKFINTVHDEINFNVSREHLDTLVPIIIGCMRHWYPFWKFPMKVGLDIGYRWGQTVTFNYDETSHIELTEEDKLNPNIQRFRHLTQEEQEKYNTYGPSSYIPDVNGNYKKNPNYLHITEPAGEDLDESDYKVKEKEVIVQEVEEDLSNFFNDIEEV